jgi:C1A family cysteine protease
MSTFVDFIATFNKTYTTLREYYTRAAIFESNLKYIHSHNSDVNKPYTLSVNEYADMSWNEFKTKYVGNVPYVGVPRRVAVASTQLPPSLPTHVDWRQTNKVSPIKNQRACGSCWAFSAISSIETNHAILNGTLVALSEQQLVDCSTENSGCNGGLMDLAFQYAESHSICAENEYPYEAYDGKCKPCGGIINVKSIVDIPAGDEDAMKEAVSRGAISVAIEADKMDFQFYSAGVFNSKTCGTNLDHGVSVIGYGVDADRGDYWIVRNSWGDSWGEKGYIRLARGVNQCGVALSSSYPVL